MLTTRLGLSLEPTAKRRRPSQRLLPTLGSQTIAAEMMQTRQLLYLTRLDKEQNTTATMKSPVDTVVVIDLCSPMTSLRQLALETMAPRLCLQMPTL